VPTQGGRGKDFYLRRRLLRGGKKGIGERPGGHYDDCMPKGGERKKKKKKFANWGDATDKLGAESEGNKIKDQGKTEDSLGKKEQTISGQASVTIEGLIFRGGTDY